MGGDKAEMSELGGRWLVVDDEKNNLDRLILESEVMDQEGWEHLLKNIKWMGTLYEFLYMAKNTISKEFRPDNAVVLGLSNLFASSQAMADFLGGVDWNPKYEEYGIWVTRNRADEKGQKLGIEFNERHTEELLTRLFGDDKVRSIVFLVPQEMYSHSERSGGLDHITKDEFDFLLRHLELVIKKKVYLVFGAYEVVDEDNFDDDMSAGGGRFFRKEKEEVQIAGGQLANEFRDFVRKIVSV